MANQTILDKVRLLRTIIEDSDLPAEDKEDAQALLREIEEEARK
jgi:hypothetical protein